MPNALESSFDCARCKLPFATRQMLVEHEVSVHEIPLPTAVDDVAELYG